MRTLKRYGGLYNELLIKINPYLLLKITIKIKKLMK